MINKEEIEKAKEFLKQEIINAYSEKKAEMLDIIYKYISELEEENNVFKQAHVDNSKIIAGFDVENYKLNNRIKELEEIEKEHQKENGNLRQKIKRLEKKNEELKADLAGKTIQEMGMSNLYKEDKR